MVKIAPFSVFNTIALGLTTAILQTHVIQIWTPSKISAKNPKSASIKNDQKFNFNEIWKKKKKFQPGAAWV